MDRELVEFIQDSFGSAWAVEVLLLLHREPGRIWAPGELIVELRSSDAVVAKGLQDLLAAGLVVTEGDGGVRYGPISADQDRLVRQLAEAYRVKPGPVRRVIVQGPAETLRTFSDAFRIKE
jgi:hypothetical protein